MTFEPVAIAEIEMYEDGRRAILYHIYTDEGWVISDGLPFLLPDARAALEQRTKSKPLLVGDDH